MVYPIKLDGARIDLREFAETDISALHRIYGDPSVTRNLSFEPRTLDQVRAIVANAIDTARQEPRSIYMLAVAQRDTDELVGSARLAIDERPHSAQIGFAINASCWGRGFGTETVSLLLRLGFN